MKKSDILSLVCVLAICSIRTNSAKIHVNPQTGHFVDEHGRTRMFRGFNSVIKEHPW